MNETTELSYRKPRLTADEKLGRKYQLWNEGRLHTRGPMWLRRWLDRRFLRELAGDGYVRAKKAAERMERAA